MINSLFNLLGDLLTEFLTNRELVVMNDEDSNPTFSRTQGVSWIDILLTCNMTDVEIDNWHISDVITLSDHNYMFFNCIFSDIVNSYVGCRWQLIKLNWLNFHEKLHEIVDCYKNVLIGEDTIDTIIEAVVKDICQACVNTKKFSKKTKGKNEV